MELEIQHKCHDHPLVFFYLDDEKMQAEIRKKDDHLDGGNSKVSFKCECCRLSISLTSSAYGCISCKFFLHKVCARLPTEIEHPSHPNCTLTLAHSDFKCNSCSHKPRKAFFYQCSSCEFYIEARCSVGILAVKLSNHHHTVRPMLRRDIFKCGACGIKHEEGPSYLCNTCRLWVHEDCALLPATYKFHRHAHRLTLVYSFAEMPSRTSPLCFVCVSREFSSKKYWFYFCEGCKYVVDVKCSANPRNKKPLSQLQDVDMDSLVKLPLSIGLTDLTNQFVKKLCLQEEGIRSEIYNWQWNKETKEGDLFHHFSHQHPLTLVRSDLLHSDDDRASITNKVQKICAGCVLPISNCVDYYACSSLCDRFFIHKWCAELPDMLQSGRRHPLILSKESPDKFKCSGCMTYCNGFKFICEYPSSGATSRYDHFELDVKCASLPPVILHETHEHPLHLVQDCNREGCAACDRCDQTLAYNCKPCYFSLHTICAMMPNMIKHRYDKHQFVLIRDPIVGGPTEYVCELCEEDIDPTYWFYHCVHCDQSACAECLCKVQEEYMNLNPDVTYDLPHRHQHPVILVRVRKPGLSCHNCHLTLFHKRPALKCLHCNILIHVENGCEDFGYEAFNR